MSFRFLFHGSGGENYYSYRYTTFRPHDIVFSNLKLTHLIHSRRSNVTLMSY